ncbi:MAG TPA: TerC family protein [Marmoricola sp.]|nr:TerC family protein [Marmoricola sp.]
MHVSVLTWVITIAVTLTILGLDVFVLGRKPHEPSRRELILALSSYVALALIFGVGVIWVWGSRYGGEFYAGWLTEYSLSVDNLFVFLLLMARFSVPRQLQSSALMVGIVVALIFRGLFIGVGAAAINAFSWVFYIFGAFLVFTALNLLRGEDEEADESSRLVLWLQKRVPMTDEWNGSHFFARIDGRRLATPMLMVAIALGTTDLLFALDSIPAIYGLTSQAYLVFAANVFALMGLRQLYFLLGNMLERLHYLSYGLSFLLAFIGVKLVLHALHENTLPFINGGHPVHGAPDVSTAISLAVIVGTMAVTVAASLIRERREVTSEGREVS